MSPEEFCAFAQAQVTPGASPFAEKNLRWRQTSADPSLLARYAREPWNEPRACIFSQIGAGNLFAPKLGTLALHDPASDWNPFAGVQGDPPASQRKIITARLEAVVLQPRLPYGRVRVGKGKAARKILAQPRLRLPAELDARAALIRSCERLDTTGNPAALTKFVLHHDLSDPEGRELVDDILEIYGIGADLRTDFFDAHAINREKAVDSILADMILRRREGAQRWAIYRGLPDAIRENLEARQQFLIGLERDRAAALPP